MLRRTHPAITVITREGSTPALVRGLRAGTLDLALLASAPPFRPPDAETQPLDLLTLAERSLCVAVPATHPLARGDAVDVTGLHGQRWTAHTAHTARDGLAELNLVAAGCGITTVPASLATVVPAGVRVLPVPGGPEERRRLMLARLPGPPPSSLPEAVARLAGALRVAARAT